jgi:hypothetical protein
MVFNPWHGIEQGVELRVSSFHNTTVIPLQHDELAEYPLLHPSDNSGLRFGPDPCFDHRPCLDTRHHTGVRGRPINDRLLESPHWEQHAHDSGGNKLSPGWGYANTVGVLFRLLSDLPGGKAHS